MCFWNDDNFNGLKEIGEKYASDSQYEAFSRYCLPKEKRLKKEAKTAIEQFIVYYTEAYPNKEFVNVFYDFMHQVISMSRIELNFN